MFHSIRHFFIILFIFIITAATVSAQTDSITLAWDPNDPAEQVVEYRLYYKTGVSGPPYDGVGLDQGASPIIIPVSSFADENNPQFDLSGLTPDVTYRFAMTAFNEIESDYSKEVTYTDQALVDADYDGYTQNQGDCDDSDATIHPGASEICGDGIDQDCNGTDLICGDDIDDDYDGYTENQGDCDDSDATIHPGASEICGDGIDQDCNGTDLICGDDIDDDYDGYTENQGDCDDSDATIHPGASEICGDGIDQDCNGTDLTCEEDFTLTVNAYKIKGDKYANLNWSGANSTYIDVYRNDSMIDTIANDGEYIHGPFRAGKPATYRVCEAVTSTCSNEITVGW